MPSKTLSIHAAIFPIKQTTELLGSLLKLFSRGCLKGNLVQEMALRMQGETFPSRDRLCWCEFEITFTLVMRRRGEHYKLSSDICNEEKFSLNTSTWLVRIKRDSANAFGVRGGAVVVTDSEITRSLFRERLFILSEKWTCREWVHLITLCENILLLQVPTTCFTYPSSTQSVGHGFEDFDKTINYERMQNTMY